MKVRIHPEIISFLGAVFIRLLGLTWRFRFEGEDNLKIARELSGNVIFSFWHSRLLVLSYTHRGENIQVLASQHSDGDLMGRTIRWLQFGHLKGSTTRGGAGAIRKLVSVLKRGLDVGLTVDGPTGPRGVVQQGAVEISRMTGSAVIPISSTARRRILFNSWDKFQLPLPFTDVIVSYGKPVVVGQGAGIEEREKERILIQNRLNELTSNLDRKAGHKGSDVWPHENS